MSQISESVAKEYRVAPMLIVAQVLGPGFIVGCAILFVAAGFIGMFRYADNWRHFSFTIGAAIVSGVIGAALGGFSLVQAARAVRILRNAAPTNARIEDKRRIRGPKRLGVRPASIVVFTVSCGNDEGEVWEAQCHAGFEGEDLDEGDFVDAVYNRKDRTEVLLLPYIPGVPTLGEDGVFRPASNGSVIGFTLVGAFCIGLWLIAVFMPFPL